MSTCVGTVVVVVVSLLSQLPLQYCCGGNGSDILVVVAVVAGVRDTVKIKGFLLDPQLGL